MRYLWGCGLIVSRTPGAMQAPSSGVGGRRAGGPALRVPAPPRPAGRRCRPPTASVGGRLVWEAGVGATRGAPPARPSPARPRPARPGTPAPPLPAGRGGAPLPKGPPHPFAAAGGQGREGGGGPRGRGQGEALRLAGCAAQHPPRGWPWPGPHVEQRY